MLTGDREERLLETLEGILDCLGRLCACQERIAEAIEKAFVEDKPIKLAE